MDLGMADGIRRHVCEAEELGQRSINGKRLNLNGGAKLPGSWLSTTGRLGIRAERRMACHADSNLQAKASLPASKRLPPTRYQTNCRILLARMLYSR